MQQRQYYHTLNASGKKNIDAHQPQESKELEVNDGKDKQQKPERFYTQKRHFCKPVGRLKNINEVDAGTRYYAVERIIGLWEKNRRKHYVVRWYECMLRHDMVGPLERVSDHFAKYWLRSGKRTTAPNTQGSEYSFKQCQNRMPWIGNPSFWRANL